MNDRPTLDEIRARCALPVTQVVTNPREYLRLQTILRDRAELLRLLDECIADRDAADEAGAINAEERVRLAVKCDQLRKERDDYMALAVMNNAEALRSALTRALNLLRIGMDVGLEPHERAEANALLAECTANNGRESP